MVGDEQRMWTGRLSVEVVGEEQAAEQAADQAAQAGAPRTGLVLPGVGRGGGDAGPVDVHEAPLAVGLPVQAVHG